MLFTELVEVLDPEPHSAALNMAIDEVLLRVVQHPTLRIYRWRDPALSFGYFGRITEVEQVAAGRALVRRWTGGGIVEHGEDVTYTLVVPRGHPFFQHAAPESYRRIHEAIAQLLTGEGIGAVVVPAAQTQVSGACFANPVQYDLMLSGSKIAGAAQRRTRWGLLHQGSVCLGIPAPGLAEKLAASLGECVRQTSLTADVLEAARPVAESKYSTSAWMRKY